MTSTPQRLRVRRGVIVAGAAAITLGLGGCTVANSQQAAAAPDDTVRVILTQEPPTLEPCESNLTSTGVVVRSTITEPLVERDPRSGELLPLLSTGWEQTGETEWTFDIREGVSFQDGSEFDAEDAAFSIDRAVNSDLGCNVEGYIFGDDDLVVEAVDATTLTVTTPRPDPILPLRLSFIEIVPAETDVEAKVREPIGTGPYEIDRWDAGSSITLARFDDYWGQAPEFGGVQYQWRGEGTVRAAMVTGGEADIALGLSTEDNVGDLGVSYPNNETIALRFAGETSPLSDIRVRQAISYAIDKDVIIDALYPDGDTVAAQLVPEGVVGFNDSLTPWPFDVERAKALVDEARADGVDVDQRILFVARTAQFPKVDELSEVLRQQMEETGLNVELRMVETSQHLQYQLRPFVTNEGPIIVLVQHGNQAGDAQFTADQYLLSTGPQSEFGNAEFDEMITTAAGLSGQERQNAYAEIFRYAAEDILQLAPLAHQTALMGMSDRIVYEPNSASGDELRIAEIRRAG